MCVVQSGFFHEGVLDFSIVCKAKKVFNSLFVCLFIFVFKNEISVNFLRVWTSQGHIQSTFEVLVSDHIQKVKMSQAPEVFLETLVFKRNKTSSNQRLWECVRCRNFNTDTLND